MSEECNWPVCRLNPFATCRQEPVFCAKAQLSEELSNSIKASRSRCPIEAAQLAKWIKELKWKSIDKDNMEFEVITTCYVRDALLKWATAAAEVGDQQPDDTFAHGVCVMKERCAQVAENFEWGKDDDNSTLAAAIRALKD